MDQLRVGNGRVQKRILTKARKEQNRAAQQAYRQRQKDKKQQILYAETERRKTTRLLQPRENIALPEGTLLQGLNPLIEICGLINNPKDSSQLPLDTSQLNQHDSYNTPQNQSPIVSPGSIDDTANRNADVNESEFSLTSGFTALAGFPVSTTWFGTMSMDALNIESLEVDPHFQFSPGAQLLSSVESTSPHPFMANQHFHFPITDEKIESIDASPALCPIQDEAEETTQFPNHNDPVANMLDLTKRPVFYATLRNAHVLGITISQLLTARHLSPFYRQTSPADDPKALVAAAYNPSFPPHLQPTLPQIMYPHHAYLDLLPFPTLRARAIAMSVARPRLFDHQELKKDIVINGGFSWDMHSWQIAPWFFKKWRMLLVQESSGLMS